MSDIASAVPTGLKHLMQEENKGPISGKNVLGKDDFMKLLLTQLQHQDPLKPMEHQEFATQLAQFSSLEQLANLGAGIQGVKSSIGDQSKLQALAMIGKDVQAATNEVNLTEGQSISIRFQGQADIKPSKATIYTMDGKPVRELDLSKGSDTEVEWDGKSNDGFKMPTGKYAFRVQGTDNVGQIRELGTGVSGKVVGMEMQGQSPVLVVETSTGRTRLDLAKVSKVADESQSAPPPPKKPAMTMAMPTQPAPAMPTISMNEDGSFEMAQPTEQRSEAEEEPYSFRHSWDPMEGMIR